LEIKARSLLVTLWGDSVAPHGGTVWLGSLIELVRCLGLNERAVRTSVFRLKNERILSSHQKGRKSFYTLTPSGQHRFEEATKRIYNHLPEQWDKEWTLLFTERRKLAETTKKQFAAELNWLGFGDLGSGIHAHPNAKIKAIENLIEDLRIHPHVAIMKAASIPNLSESPTDVLVRKGWDLESIESGYKDFTENFKPICDSLKAGDELDNMNSFVLRTLLVHDYRRALLRDPMLPDSLLPSGWTGNDARTLFHNIYQLIWKKAEEYLLNILETTDGKMPEASEEFTSRFGGLN
jgi:phenylacetic acid degradation operon negative regulatory protein